MSTIPRDSESWIGSTLVDGRHHKLGTIEEIYVDEESELPLWMVVRTGRFGHVRHTFVPIADARRAGDAVVTPHARAEIEHAPSIDVAEEVPDEELRELYRHYGLPYALPFEDPCDNVVERVLGYLDIRQPAT